LRRSKEPVSDLEYQHRLTADDPELSKGDVTRAINQLLERQLITVASTLFVDYEKVRMLAPADEPKPVVRKPMSAETRRKISEAARRRAARGPMPEETKRKIAEVFRGRKFSEETRRKISEAQRRRHAARKALGVAP
jgi:hypothetical protein